MLSIAKNNLFTEVAVEESATVSGGQATSINFDLNSYLFIVGAGSVFGAPGLTPDELQYAFEQSITTGSGTTTTAL